MGKIAEQFDYVVGVDTHARTHTYTLVAATTGVVAGTETFPTSAAGMRRAIAWVRRRSGGRRVFAAVEGTSSYGAKLTEALHREQIPVGEIRPPAKSSRPHGGKSDPIDAEAAARFALARDDGEIAQPRTRGKRQALRVLLAARHLIDGQRTANRNALTALLRVTVALDEIRSQTSSATPDAYPPATAEARRRKRRHGWRCGGASSGRPNSMVSDARSGRTFVTRPETSQNRRPAET